MEPRGERGFFICAGFLMFVDARLKIRALNMVTVHNCVKQFCKRRSLPRPLSSDLEAIGRTCLNQFREKIIALAELGSFSDNDTVPATGFVVLKRGKKFMVVAGYPDDMQKVIERVCERYFSPERVALSAQINAGVKAKLHRSGYYNKIPPHLIERGKEMAADIEASGENLSTSG
jgi:hypothetical protein